MKKIEAERLAKKNGWSFTCHGGEHDKWNHQYHTKSMMIPRHKGKDFKVGLVKEIQKLIKEANENEKNAKN